MTPRKHLWILAILTSGCGKKTRSYEVSNAAENSASDNAEETREEREIAEQLEKPKIQ